MEFWVVDPEACEVEVWTRDGKSVTYGPGREVPLFFSPGGALNVDAIFA